MRGRLCEQTWPDFIPRAPFFDEPVEQRRLRRVCFQFQEQHALHVASEFELDQIRVSVGPGTSMRGRSCS
jgi:hypothetical protein